MVQIDVSGNIIKWDDGTTLTLMPEGNEIKVHFEYQEERKDYTIIKTQRKKYEFGKIVEKRGLVLR